jgi:hypothetical protein
VIITINTSSRTSQLVFSVSLFVFGAVLCGTAAYSWTGPTGAPPDSNVAAPLNVGTASQIKDGALSVNGFSNVGSSYIAGDLGVDITSPLQKVHVNGRVRATGFCIGATCITAWPDEGGYGATAYTPWLSGTGSWNTCPSGRVMTGLQTTSGSGGVMMDMRIRCTVLNP